MPRFQGSPVTSEALVRGFESLGKSASTTETAKPYALEQVQHLLRQSIGLRDHRSTSVFQDLLSRQLRRFLGNVGINDACAVGSGFF